MRIRLFITAIAGLFVSGYLYIAYTTNGPILCGDHASCDIVRASEYANIFGFPTPLYGLVFYIVLAFAAIISTPANLKKMQLPLYFLTGAGVAVSLWLSYIEQFILHAWCIWCAASAILALLAFVFVWFPRWSSSPKDDIK